MMVVQFRKKLKKNKEWKFLTLWDITARLQTFNDEVPYFEYWVNNVERFTSIEPSIVVIRINDG